MAWIKNWFSNFLPLDKPFLYQGIEFNTVETFFQAMKTHDINERRKIAAMYPAPSKKYVKTLDLRPDWHDIRINVMEYALRKKFAPGTTWHKKLIETEGEIIEWNNWGDRFWGADVKDKKGENHLGKLLMKIRDEYKQ